MRELFRTLLTALLALMIAPNVHADLTTTYTIHFSLVGGGPLPTSGSFVYDSTTNQFLSFTVQWNGLTYDLTSSANNPQIEEPPPCIGGTTGPQATLALMTVCGAEGYDVASWVAVYGAPCVPGAPFHVASFDFQAAVVETEEQINVAKSFEVPPPPPDQCLSALGSYIARPTWTWRPPPTGLTPGQIIRIIAGPVYVPPGVPVEVNLGFVDVNGANIGPQLTKTLTQGQTATLDLNADTLQLPGRILVRPVVTVVNPNGLPSAAAGSPPAVFIPEVTEVFDTATGFGRVLIPGDTAFAAHPVFAFQGLALGQTIQLIASAFANTGCSGTLGFADVDGNPVGPTKQVTLQPGQTASLELQAGTLGLAPRQRKEIQPVVSPLVSAAAGATDSACQATTEVFETITGRTWTYQPGERELPELPAVQ